MELPPPWDIHTRTLYEMHHIPHWNRSYRQTDVSWCIGILSAPWKPGVLAPSPCAYMRPLAKGRIQFRCQGSTIWRRPQDPIFSCDLDALALFARSERHLTEWSPHCCILMHNKGEEKADITNFELTVHTKQTKTRHPLLTYLEKWDKLSL